MKFEAAVKSRSEELEALAKARTVISEKTGGAESFTYGLTQTSFLHLSRSVLSLRGGPAKFDRVGAARISCCFRDARRVVKWRRSFCQGEGFDQRDDLEAWKTRRLLTLPTRPTVTKSFPRAGRRRRQKLLSSRSFLPQSTRKLQNLLSSREKFQSCRHPWASSQRPRLL